MVGSAVTWGLCPPCMSALSCWKVIVIPVFLFRRVRYSLPVCLPLLFALSRTHHSSVPLYGYPVPFCDGLWYFPLCYYFIYDEMILDHPQLLPYQLRVSPYTYLYGPLLIYCRSLPLQQVRLPNMSCYPTNWDLPLQQVMGPVVAHWFSEQQLKHTEPQCSQGHLLWLYSLKNRSSMETTS